MLLAKVGKGYVGISILSQFEVRWLDSIMKARDAFPNAYLQAIKADHILDERHVIVSLYNVLMAHELGYAKMKRIDTELLLNLSGTNNFEDALAQLAPFEGQDAVIVSYSDDENAARGIMEFLMKETGAKMQSLKSNADRIRNLMKIYDLKLAEEFSEQSLLDLLIERSAMFYVRYR